MGTETGGHGAQPRGKKRERKGLTSLAPIPSASTSASDDNYAAPGRSKKRQRNNHTPSTDATSPAPAHDFLSHALGGLVLASMEGQEPWPARIMCLEEIALYRTASGGLAETFPEGTEEIAVVLLFPPHLGQDFAIQVGRNRGGGGGGGPPPPPGQATPPPPCAVQVFKSRDLGSINDKLGAPTPTGEGKGGKGKGNKSELKAKARLEKGMGVAKILAKYALRYPDPPWADAEALAAYREERRATVEELGYDDRLHACHLDVYQVGVWGGGRVGGGAPGEPRAAC